LAEVEEFVTGYRTAVEPDRAVATVSFTDIVGSTERASALGDRAWADLLERFRGLVSAEVAKFRGRVIDAQGDEVLATFDGPARAIQAATAIIRSVATLDLEVRTGLHTGEIQFTETGVAGLAVHIGARVVALAGPGEVLVSRTVRDLVAGSGLSFTEHGTYKLKGVPDEWQLYSVS
jgi:class 3 adenylate cyclase